MMHQETIARYALYFMLPTSHPLGFAGAAWLRCDAFSDNAMRSTEHYDRLVTLTAKPRRYGFHGTIKAPFRLAPSQNEAGLLAAFSDFCANQTAFTLPRLALSRLGSFYALVPDCDVSELQNLAGETVTFFEPFRAELTPAEIKKRNPKKLSEPERKNLMQWGYPYVFDTFRFHMTLSDSVGNGEDAWLRTLLDLQFPPALLANIPIHSLALVIEPAPGEPFEVLAQETFSTPIKATA